MQSYPPAHSISNRNTQKHDEVLQQLKQNYDGYHFSWPSPDIFNPFSLLTAFAKRKIGSYWFASGTPTYLIEMVSEGVAQNSSVHPPNTSQSGCSAM